MAAQTCFTDDLQHPIFSFLPLADISSSSAVCRRWSSAVSSEPPRAVRCEVRSASSLRDLANSNLRRHVKTLDITQDDAGDPAAMMVDDLPELICRRMTSITHLLCTVDLQRLDELQFPADLRTLEVKIIVPQPTEDEWHNLPVLLECVAHVPLTKLRITTEWEAESLPSAAALEPLRQLRDSIADLGLHWASDDQWTADHFDLFHSLPLLTRFDTSRGWWGDEELDLLTADPMPTRLQSLSCSMAVSSHRLLSISRMASLTELAVSFHQPKDELFDLAVLGQLTRLETLHLTINRQIDTAQVITAIKTCTSITDLALQRCRQLADAHLCDLLPVLTGLRRLDLCIEDELDDLSCLSVASNLAGSLEHIRITGTAVPYHALFHLRSLRRLKSAEVKMRITRRWIGTKHTTAASDSEAVFMPMLEDLRIRITNEGGVDLKSMMGRLPQLRVMDLECDVDTAVPPLVQFLTHAHSLTSLNWHHEALTDEHLCTLMPSLPHLRELALPGHALMSLRFVSASAQLEQLTLADPGAAHSLPVNELARLRSLGALRHLKLVLRSIAPAVHDHDHSEQSPSNCTDISAASLASLTSLHVDTQDMQCNSTDPLELDLSLLGPIPQLRSCQLWLNRGVQVESIARALAHSTQLIDLLICHPALTDEQLVELMPHLTHLRSLEVYSESHLGGLSFASSAVAPRLAATLTRLHMRTTDSTPMKPSDLHHLRVLANLTNLRLCFPQSRASLAADLEEMTPTSPHFRRDCWPRLRYFDDIYCE